MNKGIQKNLLKILSFTIVFIAVLLINKKIYAKSYTIDNMDIQAEIQRKEKEANKLYEDNYSELGDIDEE